MASGRPRKLRPIIWLGNSRRNILVFPEPVRKLIGEELQLIQFGGMPRSAKPFKGIGPGVIEIAVRHDRGACRCVQAVRPGGAICVLHAFQKKSRTGMAAPGQDVDLIGQRLVKIFQCQVLQCHMC